MKKEKTSDSESFIEKKEPNTTSPYNALLIPVSIILAGLLVTVSVLITAKAGLVTKSNLKSTLEEVLKNQNLSAGTPAPTQAETAYNPNKITEIVAQKGVDKDKFTQCYNNGETEAEVNKDMKDATEAGVRGTPGFVIGKLDANGQVTGHRIKGAYPFEYFQQVITAQKEGKTAELEAILDETDPTGAKTGSKYLFPTATANIDDDAFIGKKENVEFAIIEFSDLECPFCQRHFLQTLPQLKSEYVDSGKAIIVFRDHIAVPSHNPAALEEAMALECVKKVAGNEKYIEIHDYIFQKTRLNGKGLP